MRSPRLFPALLVCAVAGGLTWAGRAAGAEDGAQGRVARGALIPAAFEVPGWSRWNAMKLGAEPGAYLRLTGDAGGAAIGRIGNHFRVIMRARLDAEAGTVGRLMAQVGGATHGFACGYDPSTKQLVFGLRSDTSYVMRCAFEADGSWRDFEFRFDSGTMGRIYIDGLNQILTHEGGQRAASLSAPASSGATVGAAEGDNPLAALALLGAGAGWQDGAGANALEGEVAYLRIERYPNGLRDLEMYLNEGEGAPRDFTNALTPQVVGTAQWTTVAEPSYIRRWRMQTPGEEFLFGATLSTDEDADPDSPTTTVPMIVEAPGGGTALRCRVFQQWGRHSEWRAPVPSPTALDTYLAFDIYADGSMMTNGGNPFRNWIHWLRIGEEPGNEPAVFVGHHDHDLDGDPGVRLHIVSGPVPAFDGHVPLNQWRRVLVRYRAGRDGLGQVSLSDGVNPWATLTISKNDTGEIRLRARSDGTPGAIYFRNVALGTDPQEVMFGADEPEPAETCGVLIEQGGCVVLAADDGLVYALENLGGFAAGDRVVVGGLLDEDCESKCPETGGCFLENSIDPCFIGCGRLVEGPGGCLLFRSQAGADHAIENTGLYTLGDWVFVIGSVDAGGAGLCPGFEGPAIVANAVVRCYSACGALEVDDENCLTFVVLNGDRFLLENEGGFGAGARVFVRGRVNPGSGSCGGTVYAFIETNSIRSCSPDFNGDGVVNAADLAVLLGAWGLTEAPEDITGDGVVNAADLAAVLGAWG